MANIKDRPYIGTWSLDGRKLVQHTPDALIYVNGSTSLPRCGSCDGRINLQKFVTEVSVEAGTDPAGASASFTLSIPLHSSDAFARDAKFLLHPGLEVHVYERGYFPVKGLYSNLAEPVSSGSVQSIPSGTGGIYEEDAELPDKEPTVPRLDNSRRPRASLVKRPVKSADGGYSRASMQAYADRLGVSLDHLTAAVVGNSEAQSDKLRDDRTVVYHSLFNRVVRKRRQGKTTDVFDRATGAASTTGSQGSKREFSSSRFPQGKKLDSLLNEVAAVLRQRVAGGKRGAASGTTHFTHTVSQRSNRLSPEAVHQRRLAQGLRETTGEVFPATRNGKDIREHIRTYKEGPVSDADVRAQATAASKPDPTSSRRDTAIGASSPWVLSGDAKDQAVLSASSPAALGITDPSSSKSLLERSGRSGIGIEDVAAYPYYHTFHGVVIQVSHSYSGGFQTVTVQCASMLHFWQYHKINTNFAITAKVENDGPDRTAKGHNYSGMHPYEIMHHLHRQTFGSHMITGDVLKGQDTNQQAVDGGTGRGLGSRHNGLPSLMQVYWERRFNDRIVNLRMHGFSGTLYSSLQAAALATHPGKKLAKKILNRFKGKSDYSSLEIPALSLNNDRSMRGLTFSSSSLAGPTPSRKSAFDITGKGKVKDAPQVNVADMQAFVFNVSNTANWGLFESTYVSKLDVAQKVMEVTGFEFYQDVDGDFVFKPPMWNLDTSSSRVYRIEDIDIINLSFDEKEPQCTYTIVKNGLTAASGTAIGMTGDNGYKATYVDFRLVSKFGYRPFECETSYLGDSRSMYYMGVAKMDVINIATHSASCTIPIRPEIRPGYPVYIPYLDCYYYIRSMSHSYSVGGQCTTTLQLVGKRSKFYAPGLPAVAGIDAIDLGNPTLPQRPLEVQGGNGLPRLSGFPNCVMALDPDAVNPMHYPSGADVSRLETDTDFRSFLRMAGNEGIGILATQGDGFYTFNTVVGYTADGTPISKPTSFYFDKDVKAKASGQKKGVGAAKAIPEGAIEISKAAKAYRKFNAALKSTANAGTSSDESAESEILNLDAKLRANQAALAKVADQSSAEHKALTADRTRTVQQIDLWRNAKGNPTAVAILSSDVSPGVTLIYQILELFSDRFWVSKDTTTFEDMTTYHLAQLLNNKKSNFSANGQPGAYRYYSGSHPDPKQQGQPLLTYQVQVKGGVDLKKTPQRLGSKWADTPIKGYVRQPDVVAGTTNVEAKIQDVRPVRGMLVQTNVSGGEVLPTSEIRTLMFSTQVVEGNKLDVNYDATRAGTAAAAGIYTAIKDKFTVRGTGKAVTSDNSITEVFAESWEKVWVIVEASQVQARRRFKEWNSDYLYTFEPIIFQSLFPESIDVYALSASTEKAAKEFSFGSETGTIKIAGLRTPETLTLEGFFDKAGDGIAAQLAKTVGHGFTEWYPAVDRAIEKGTITQAGADQIMSAFSDSVAAGLKFPLAAATGSQQLSKGRHKTTTWSAVFPVSDALGYEVVGSFQYGRGLDIEPGGVWDTLRSLDPLSILDRKTTDDIISAVIRGEPVTVEVERTLFGGRKVTEKKPLSGQAARSAVERKAFKMLRKNYTDQQLIDLGLLLKSKKDPTKYEFGLMNWISTQKEGVHKLPVINAAFSLADLSFQQDGKICDCKAAEANSQIEAYGNTGFLNFTSGGTKGPPGAGTGDADQATKWLQSQVTAAAVPHKTQQDAMRKVSRDK